MKQESPSAVRHDIIVIAIDGPSASGKSTVARKVAEKLGFVYVDTGAMYRTLAWRCVVKDIDVYDPKAVSRQLRSWHWQFKLSANRHVQLWVDDYFPDKEIRTEETSIAVPHIAAIPRVREWMVERQRECSQFGNLVMEGRDIGTVVFPATDFKYFIDASLEERKRRRSQEGNQECLATRDQRDSQRKAAPLLMALGAKRIDTTGMSIDMVVDTILADLQNRGIGNLLKT